ncbi:hypothetical protein [Streptomyces sp. NPDC058254]|uniref:hypothetical protein n=1 Tax=Streptomyces sp. NPDC058254 TaxID=3346406 RepID=UPI0036EB650C
MTAPTPTAPPGPGFVTGIRLATGVLRRGPYNVAQLLAFHVPPRLAHETTDHIADGMRRFADALRLGPADQEPPMIGHRIRIRSGRPWLDYGDDEYRLCVSAAPSWVRLVADGAPVRVCVMFDPLDAGLGQDATDAHVRACFASGAMRWGTTYHI